MEMMDQVRLLCRLQVLTITPENGNDSGGFFSNDPEELGFDDCLSFPVTDPGGGLDLKGIEEYVKSLKMRAQESNHVEGSSTRDESLNLSRLELWMLPVPVIFFHVLFMIE